MHAPPKIGALGRLQFTVALALGWLTIVLTAQPADAQAGQRLRVMVETDAGGDPDDEQSLVRFLLYANEWDVEGIIANRPLARAGENRNRERTGLGIVRALLDAYGQCHPSLLRHDPRYPTRDALWARSVPGYADTDEGVRLVLAAVDAPDSRPVWFCNWGTDHGSAPSCLRRALDRVRAERGPEGYARFKSRVRLSSYDAFGDHTWTLAPPFPFWVDTFRPELDRRRWYHRFSALTATAGGFELERDVRTGHGPLGALYPTNTTHPQKEGDTMAFLYLVPTGMNLPDQPAWGSWAGRYGPMENADGRAYFWANQIDAWRGTTNRDQTLARWAAALQNDFRARLDWCVRGPLEANHRPQIDLRGIPAEPALVRRQVRAGDRLEFDASASRDPDADRLEFAWWVYAEAGTWSGEVQLDGAEGPQVTVRVPAAAAAHTVHLILEVRDTGAPPLTAYRRLVLDLH